MPSTTQLEGATQLGDDSTSVPEARKLILCFDGTGNSFTGTNSDTNVVKLLNKLDRNDPNQFHYYQTGIGTYDTDATSVDQSFLGKIKSNVDQTLDSGFGSGFDSHVLAGYRFLMRYYESGDKIYMFGFSRGAFTAKFLARMVNTVGLLCKGNEEMVPFVYKLYQRSLAGKIRIFGKGTDKQRKDGERKAAKLARHGAARLHHGEDQPLLPDHDDHEHDEDDHKHSAHNELEAFSDTFCRKEKVDCGHGHTEEQNIKVYFLGLWDCVSSVAVLEQQAPKPVQMAGTAVHVRHAVAVDERRVKFKAALFDQDKMMSTEGSGHEHEGHEIEDLKEVWFPGCHGDVGGGWPASKVNPLDTKKDLGEWSWWDRIKNVFTKRKDDESSQSLEKGPLQMSDIPLAWMIRELELVGDKDPSAAVKWREDGLQRFKKKFMNRKYEALKGIYHDSLRFGYGTSLGKVLLWKFLEWFPLIRRWEFVDNDWQFVWWPLNMGNTRDIPRGAELHSSLLYRLKNPELNYFPQNNHGEGDKGSGAPCLKHEGKVRDVQPKRAVESTLLDSEHLKQVVQQAGGDALVLHADDPFQEEWLSQEDVFHRTWTFCAGDPSG